MEMVLVITGALLALVGLVWVLALAFSESALWGLACLFIPVAVLVFVALHPQSSWKAASLYLIGVVCLLAGLAIQPA
jgi:hypothetical protein